MDADSSMSISVVGGKHLKEDMVGSLLYNIKKKFHHIISNNSDYDYAEIFADRGITGTTENGPEFERLKILTVSTGMIIEQKYDMCQKFCLHQTIFM